MLALILLLIFIFVVALISGLMAKSQRKNGEEKTSVEKKGKPEACNICATGDENCYAEKMLKGENCFDIVYFDDEELDVFCERSANSYSEAEVELFREVLYTMQAKEVRDWLHSLSLRRIELPESLRDEVLMLVE